MQLARFKFVLVLGIATVACQPPAEVKANNRTKAIGAGETTETDVDTSTDNGGGKKTKTATATATATATDTDTDTDTATATATATHTAVDALVPVANSSLTYNGDTKAILDQYCIACHGATATSGAPTTFRLDSYADVTTVKGTYSMRSSISDQVATRVMPNGTDMPDADRQTLIDWIAGGAVLGAPTPTAQVTAPATAAIPVTGGTYNVQVAFTNVPAGATWEVFYTTVSGHKTSGGTAAVAGSIPATTLVQAVNTSGLTNGTYYFYIVFHYGAAQLAVAAPGSIDVQNNHAPTISSWTPVEVQNPAAHATPVKLTNLANIVVTASDPDSDPLSYSLEYSQDGGANWVTAVASQASSSLHWSAHGGEGAHYRLRVTVSDGSNSATDTSAADFAVADNDYTYSSGAHTISGIFSNCSSCHGSGDGHAFIWDSESAAVADAANVALYTDPTTSPDLMPKTGSLTTSQRSQLYIWYLQGAAH